MGLKWKGKPPPSSKLSLFFLCRTPRGGRGKKRRGMLWFSLLFHCLTTAGQDGGDTEGKKKKRNILVCGA